MSDIAQTLPIASSISVGMEHIHKRAHQQDIHNLSTLFTSPHTQQKVVETLARHLTLGQQDELYQLQPPSMIAKAKNTLTGDTSNAAQIKAIKDSETILQGMLVEQPINEYQTHAVANYVALLYQDVMGRGAIYTSPIVLTPNKIKSQAVTLKVKSSSFSSLPSQSVESDDTSSIVRTASFRSKTPSHTLYSLMSQENDKLRHTLDTCQKAMQSLDSNNKALTQSNHQLTEQMAVVNKENREMKKQMATVNKENKEIKQQMVEMTQQFEQLKQLILTNQSAAQTATKTTPESSKPNEY